MPTQKRQRKREGRQVRQSALAARQRTARRRRTLVAAVLVGLLILGVASVVSGGGGGGDQAAKATTTTGPVKTSLPSGQAVSGATPCPPADGSAVRTTSFAQAPPMCIDPAKTYVAEIKTDKGDMTVALNAAAAPQTVNNFVTLSRYRYFDGVAFHRIIPGFVVQGGDPKGDGTGGPGYTIADEFPQAGQYQLGSLAMANTGQPSSGGSQFFIITGPQGQALPPQYALFGQVTQGLEVAKAIEAVGSSTGTPKETVKIQSVTIKES